VERVRKKRSAAAKRGWKTRLDKAKREAERLREKAGELSLASAKIVKSLLRRAARSLAIPGLLW
jgi:hypothetical protein